MENLSDYKLSTYPTLWKEIGIPIHTKLGYYYLMLSAKGEDIKDWLLYWVGMSKTKPPLLGETKEDFYIRKIYTTSYDCFHRTIKGEASTHIKICLREPTYIEGTKTLVIKEGKYKEAINFGSYNYLGFGGYDERVTPQIIDALKREGNSSCGFAREVGISEIQEKLEKKLAEFLKKEDCIILPMGFAANSTMIPILVSEGDVVISDGLNHSSMIVGIRSTGAERIIFKHNDIGDLEKKLQNLKKNGMKNGQQPKKVLVIVEGLYSMEGEFCKLREIIMLKKIYGFYLYVDEAHSIGALGKTGRGITEQLGCNFDDIDILMGTFSKSFASSGGYIASDHKTISLLRSNAYGTVYGNPMSPVFAQQIYSSLELIDSPVGVAKIAQLRKNSIALRTKFIDAGCHVLGDLESPVIPVMVYHPLKIKDISRICLENGVAIVVVAYPACPIDACRIRFCASAGHTDEDIEKGFRVTMDALAKTGCIFNNAPKPSNIYHSKDVDIKELEKKEKNPRKMEPLYKDTQNKKKICDLPVRPNENQLNISSYDINNFEKDNNRLNKMINVMNEYGCGSCGPRNFYGGTLEHVALEEEIKKFYNINEAIVISFGHNVMSSVIPVYGNQDGVIIADEFCNYSIQLGCHLSKAKILKYKHNDINDLTKKLDEAKNLVKSKYSLITIITEGVFQHDYSISPLKEISNLKKEFLKKNIDKNVSIMVDDSIGIGTIGNNLKGCLEYNNLTLDKDIDIICGSMEFCLDSVGGFIAGHFAKINKCRLFAAGYIFSASCPPYACFSSKDSFEQIDKNGKEMKEKIDGVKKEFENVINELKDKVKFIGDKNSNCLLMDYPGKNDELVKVLKSNGFYVAKQQHLAEDWCQNEFIKINLGVWFSKEKMEQFVNIIKGFN